MIGAKGFLIDLDGVLYVEKSPIKGAKECIAQLEDMGYSFRFVSNTTSKSRRTLAEFLWNMDFDIPEEYIFTPAIAAAQRIADKSNKKCFLLTRDDARKDFENAGIPLVDQDADFVIIGDAEDGFTFDQLNKAFRLIMDGADIIALEKDRYWMASDGLNLAAGPFVAALEYATGKVAKVVGKPSSEFFQMALSELGTEPRETAMIGDDINTDVLGAQKMGLMGILVMTGKYSKEVADRSLVAPDMVIKSIAELGDHL
jgi:HAD superfamily hydrolase (TIGR01458 family)